MMSRAQRTERKDRTLRPVRPNLGLEAAYRKRLYSLVEEMQRSYIYWLSAQYTAHEDRITLGQDASPAEDLAEALKGLADRWTRRFGEMAEQMAGYFAQSVEQRSTAQLRKIMKDAGWTVEFTMTQSMQDIKDAVVAENVALIKSIPAQYHSQVEGIVMRGVTAGGDLSSIAPDLQRRYGITRRRAELIARDQTRKATAAFNRVRMLDIGVTEAIWVHSGGGREPRHTHLAAGKRKQVYNLREGWFDPDPRVRKHIHPGQLINCRCVSRPIVPGFD